MRRVLLLVVIVGAGGTMLGSTASAARPRTPLRSTNWVLNPFDEYAVEAALRLIDVGRCDDRSQDLKAQAMGSKRRRVGANAHCRPLLAAYKLPRHLVIVERAQRSPSGKPDYEWARRMATAGGTAG